LSRAASGFGIITSDKKFVKFDAKGKKKIFGFRGRATHQRQLSFFFRSWLLCAILKLYEEHFLDQPTARASI
jgi:hypothetical protein